MNKSFYKIILILVGTDVILSGTVLYLSGVDLSSVDFSAWFLIAIVISPILVWMIGPLFILRLIPQKQLSTLLRVTPAWLATITVVWSSLYLSLQSGSLGCNFIPSTSPTPAFHRESIIPYLYLGLIVLPLLIGVIAFLPIFKDTKFPKSSKKILTLILIAFSITSLIFMFIFGSLRLDGARARSRDAKRIQDLRQLQNALELYFSVNGKYPDASGATARERMQNLEENLVDANIGITKIPQDFCSGEENPEYSYDYRAENDRYILRAVLQNRNMEAERYSPKGEILGLYCGERNYCVQISD